jgi:thymidylate synthase (FAD)
MKEEQIRVEYIDHMGSDLSVVNAARASFDKTSDWEYDSAAPAAYVERKLKPTDAALIRFLALGYRTAEWDLLAEHFLLDLDVADVQKRLLEFKRHAQHWAPFAHPHISLRVTTPIFIARQMVKHQVGGVWSEVSRRYVSDEPSFWFPTEWHQRPEDIKQGASGLVANQYGMHSLSRHAAQVALRVYQEMLTGGVAPEEARSVLPHNMMTTWVWTGSLAFWARVCNQRLDSHAQLAAQETARGIADHIEPLYPVSWNALVG